MRQVTRKGLITMVAAGGVLALSGGYAHADAGASGNTSNSPGVLSGNSVAVPVHAPVNACGNTVNVVALLNPALGNDCTNTSSSKPAGHDGGQHGGGHHGGHDDGGYGGGGHGGHDAGSSAEGGASNSPGVGSGNQVQAPIELPVNACGNTVTIGGLLNPVLGNDCSNDSGVSTPPEKPEHPGTPEEPRSPEVLTPYEPNSPDAQAVIAPAGSEQLAETGSAPLGMIIPASAGLLLGGAVLYRRSRASA